MAPLGFSRTVTFERISAAPVCRRPVRVQAVKKDNKKRELSKMIKAGKSEIMLVWKEGQGKF